MQRAVSLTAIIASLGAFLLLSGCTARASEDASSAAYDLSAAVTSGPVKAGTPATYQITITPKGEWVLKTTTPYKAKLSSSAEGEFAKGELTAKDFDDPKTKAKSVTATFTPKTKGDATLAADLTFFLCTDEICQRYKANASTGVRVE